MAGGDVLMVPYGHSLARVGRLLEVARALRCRDHRVLFAGSGRHLALARDDGFALHPLIELAPELVARYANRASLGFHTVDSVRRFVDEEARLLAETRPAAIVGDFRPTLRITTEVLSVPYAAVLNAGYTEYYAATRRAPRIHPLVRIIPEPMVNWLRPVVPLINRLYARPYNAVLRAHHRPARTKVEQLFAGDLNLLADLPAFAPTRNPPQNYRYVGPIVWEPSGELPQWFEENDRQLPLVYCTLGGTGAPRLIELALSALAGLPVRLAVTGGGLATPHLRAGGSTYFADFLPASKVLQRSSLLVFHGGINTAYQAMQAGVPMIGIPFNLDQEWNIDRIAELGLGLKLQPGQQTVGNLRQAVQAVLSDTGYRQRARRFAREFDAWQGGADRAGGLIEACLLGDNTSGEVAHQR